jgi:Spy/CpxP family protein refolding chaperone
MNTDKRKPAFMNLNLKIITRAIFAAIAASAFLVLAGLAAAEDAKPKSKSPEPANVDIRKERMERAEKEALKRKKEFSDLHDKERAAQLENFRKEREQREATEKAAKDEADKEKADKDKDKDKSPNKGKRIL